MCTILSRQSLFLVLGLLTLLPVSAASAHPGTVDGHGCHKTGDGTDFHCHKDRSTVDESGGAADDEAPGQPGDDETTPEASSEPAKPQQENGSADSEPSSTEAESNLNETEQNTASPADDVSASDASDQSDVEESNQSPLVREEARSGLSDDELAEIVALRDRVRDLENDKHRFDKGRAGLWLGLSVGAVAVSSLISMAVVPPGDGASTSIALSSISGSLLTGSIFSLQMGHRSPTAIAGGILVLGNFVAPIIAASSANSRR